MSSVCVCVCSPMCGDTARVCFTECVHGMLHPHPVNAVIDVRVRGGSSRAMDIVRVCVHCLWMSTRRHCAENNNNINNKKRNVDWQRQRGLHTHIYSRYTNIRTGTKLIPNVCCWPGSRLLTRNNNNLSLAHKRTHTHTRQRPART